MVFSKETLKSFAQSKGITNIDDEALQILGQDLEYRLKEISQEASKFMLASHRTKLSTGDINYALISRNLEPLFGYDSNETLIFKGLPSNVYYVPDEEIDLEEFLERPLPKIPLKPYIQSHWLAIEGVQPPIQQNPILIEKQPINTDSLTAYQEELELKQTNRHLLTKELSMYFEKIIQTLESDPQIAIDCLLNETGIQQLVPYFLHHFKVELRTGFKDQELIKNILGMYNSLISNKFIFIDPYLHEILPSLFSCIIGSTITDSSKKEASNIVKYIFQNFGSKYKSLSPRIINFLLKCWLDETKSENSQYGALYCLSILSEHIIDECLIPNMPKYTLKHSKVVHLMNSIKKGKRREPQVIL